MKVAPLASTLFLAASLALVAGDTASAARDDRHASRPAASAKQAHEYGTDRLQTLDYRPGPTRDAPLVVYVHGGGWKRGDKRMMDGSDKLTHWQAQGYAVASVNYRLVPDATVEDQAADIANAVAWLKDNAARLGFDGKRIALVGHSAGAHLVALVGTDPAYLRAAGLHPGDIAGIVPLDGAAYDVSHQLKTGPRLMNRTYRQAFGNDPARHKALSPIAHAAAPNAPEFLILHVERDDAEKQSRDLAAALRRAGTPATVQGFGGKGLRGHMEINRRLGDPDYPATRVVDAFLKKIFG